MTTGRKNTSNNKEWYTPKSFLLLVELMFGKISLDPCYNSESFVLADTVFELPFGDGILENWNDYKTIFCNPPYGKDKDRKTSIKDWIKKCHETSKTGSQIIALIPVATNTSHWKEYIFPSCSAICFIGKPRFDFVGAKNNGAPMAVCAVYWGNKIEKFSKIFGEIGNLMFPYMGRF